MANQAAERRKNRNALRGSDLVFPQLAETAIGLFLRDEVVYFYGHRTEEGTTILSVCNGRMIQPISLRSWALLLTSTCMRNAVSLCPWAQDAENVAGIGDEWCFVFMRSTRRVYVAKIAWAHDLALRVNPPPIASVDEALAYPITDVAGFLTPIDVERVLQNHESVFIQLCNQINSEHR